VVESENRWNNNDRLFLSLMASLQEKMKSNSSLVCDDYDDDGDDDGDDVAEALDYDCDCDFLMKKS